MIHSPSNTHRVRASAQCCRVRNNHVKLNLKIPHHCATVVIKFLVILELIRPMTHIQQGQEVHVASYMDGITVKISEQYKPPPRINLPISYAQRLSLNKQFEDNAPSYSFELEKRVKEQLEELKKIKNATAENRKLRSERIQEELKERKEAALKEKEVAEKKKKEVVEKLSPVFVSQESSPSCSNNNGILQPVQVKSEILKPIPLNTNGNQVVGNAEDRSPFNISDFEADTSSPFDNMELKTLNDMEELAQVLRSETAVTTTNNMPTYPPATYSSLPTHSYYNSFLNTENSAGIAQQTTNSFVPNYAQPILFNGTTDYYSTATETTPYTTYNRQNSNIYNPNFPTSTQKTVPDILKALETKLSISNGQSSGNSKRTTEDPDDPFPSLPKHLQDLAVTISTMGFPRGRVARACQLYGDDQKKVLYYLTIIYLTTTDVFHKKNLHSNTHSQKLNFLITLKTTSTERY